MSHDMKPLVSIILPVYNGEEFLRTSLDSCIAQTYTNWELILVDDCSNDSTPDIAREYEKRDSRIHYYRNDTNLRLPRNLNRGFSMANGKYLTWTSDDNYYRPTAIEKMVHHLETTENEFVFTRYSIIDAQGKELSQTVIPKDYRHAIWDDNFVGACFLYSRKVYKMIGEYDPNLFLCEDYDYWLRIFAQFPVGCLEENLYAYRKHDKSLTAKNLKGQYQAMEKAFLKNFALKKDAVTLDRYYLQRGLHRSRSREDGFIRKYAYFPKLVVYKLWRKLIYRH